MEIDVVREANEAKTPEAFEQAILARLQRWIGADIGFFACNCARRIPSTIGIDPQALEPERARPYGLELEPVRAAALARGGVAIDTEVLGAARVRAAGYYRDIAAPLGGGHSLLGFLRLRGRGCGGLMLGRKGRSFNNQEVAWLEALLPGLALAGASYDQSGAAAELALLAPREREVLDYLCLGYTNREIALALGTSPNTVRNQLAAVFGKIGASTRSEAVGIARA